MHHLWAPRKIPLAKSHKSSLVTVRGHGRMERAGHGAEGFFDVERRLEAISALGDPLETIKKIVPWEDFRTDIER